MNQNSPRFGCPHCAIPLVISDDGIEASCKQCDYKLFFDGEIWVNKAIIRNQPENYFQDIDYQSRQTTPFTTTARELRQYYKHLEELTKTLPKNKPIMDIGCGDGRFTRYFLDLGFSQVVASDLDVHNLKRLACRLSAEDKKRTCLIHASAAEIPFLAESFQGVFAIGLFNLLIDHLVDVCKHINTLLTPGGILINTDPTLEGSLLYALVRNDLGEFFEVARTHTKVVDYDSKRADRIPVFENGRIEDVLHRANLEIQEIRGISVFPSLIFGGLLQMHPQDDGVKQELVNIVDVLADSNTPIYRVKMYLSKKRHS